MQKSVVLTPKHNVLLCLTLMFLFFMLAPLQLVAQKKHSEKERLLSKRLQVIPLNRDRKSELLIHIHVYQTHNEVVRTRVDLITKNPLLSKEGREEDINGLPKYIIVDVLAPQLNKKLGSRIFNLDRYPCSLDVSLKLVGPFVLTRDANGTLYLGVLAHELYYSYDE